MTTPNSTTTDTKTESARFKPWDEKSFTERILTAAGATPSEALWNAVHDLRTVTMAAELGEDDDWACVREHVVAALIRITSTVEAAASESGEKPATPTKPVLTAVVARDIIESAASAQRHLDRLAFAYHEIWKGAEPNAESAVGDYADGCESIHDLKMELENIASLAKNDGGAS